MWTIMHIRKHIFNLQDGKPFATRDLLGYGPRNTVDKAIQRLVRQGVIIRVARGVFVKPLYEGGKLKLPTLVEIAMTKARAFSKDVLLIQGKDAAFALGIADRGNSDPTFVASGYTTSFACVSRDFGNARVRFRSINPLAKKFADSHIGLFFRAMRSLPTSSRLLQNFVEATKSLDRTQMASLRETSKWMPGWLTRFFWVKPSLPKATSEGPNFLDFLKKYMTEAEFIEYKRINVASW